MRLSELLKEVEALAVAGDLEREVTGIRYDSRRIRSGDLFFGLRGEKQDGQAFVRQALESGAVAAVVGRDVVVPGAPLVQVEEPRRALAQASAAFFRHPSRALRLVGVTGTNGKTTTTYLMESIFRAAGISTGLIGTTGYRLGEETRPAPFTTPEAPELQELLAEMAARGIRGVAVELSSHALAQRRCFDVECDVAVFTNLSREHLDYHGTLERYLDAKLMLFDGRNRSRSTKASTAVINADDPAAQRVIEAARRGGLAVTTYGRGVAADLTIADVTPVAGGTRLQLRGRDGRFEVRLGLLGFFNAWNAAAAFAAARVLGLEAAVAARGLAALRGVPGRLERVDEGQPFEVVVDYAHTPEALEVALTAARRHTGGRLLLVFGCGGDRDRGKRPLMGKLGAEASDAAWVTNDNPRTEDPGAIAAEIVAGDARGRLQVVLDRRAAIQRALEAARAGDLVLIAGKGHETTQTIGGQVLPFDDREVARALLRERSGERR